MAADCTLPECLNFFDEALTVLRSGFRAMEDRVPRPVPRVRSQVIEVRYEKPSIELAMFLKLARAISLLGGLRLMVEHGMIQEQGILQRALDEVDGDILFLSFGHQDGIEAVHEEFLEGFWAEEFEDAGSVISHRRRRSVSRRRIEEWNSRRLGVPDAPTAQSVDRIVQGVYSGFVHGASTHILDLYDLNQKRFSVAGLGDTRVRQSYVVDAANYPYRVLMSAVMVSRRLGLSQIADEFYGKLKEAESFVGLPSPKEAAELIDKMTK